MSKYISVPIVGGKLTEKISTIITLLLLTIFSLCVGGVLIVTGIVDRHASTQSLFYANKALSLRQDNLKRSLQDYAVWADLYERLHVNVDLDWAYARSNLGPSLYETYGYDGVFVINADKETTYSVIKGQLSEMHAENWLHDNLHNILENATTTESSLIGIYEIKGQPALVGAASIRPDKTVSHSSGSNSASVLLFVDILTSEKLYKLGQEYGIENLHLATQLSPSSKNDIVLYSSSIDSYNSLTWTTPQPGKRMFLWILPILLFTGASVGMLAWLAIRYLSSISNQLGSSYLSLEKSEARFRDVANISSDWLWEIDHEERFTYLSGRFEEITGQPTALWLGRSIKDFLQFKPRSLKEWVASFAGQSNNIAPLACSYKSSAGKHCLCDLVICPNNNDLEGYRGVARDITAELENKQRIQQLQQYDTLTGLPNREHLTQRLSFLQGSSTKTKLAILDIGIEEINRITTNFGRTVCDRAIFEVSQRLENFRRTDDFLAHHMPDRFMVVLDGNFGIEQYIESYTLELLRLFEQPVYVSGLQVTISAKIGVAISSGLDEGAEYLIRSAEMALFYTRRHNRRPWAILTKEIEQEYTTHVQLENDLSLAIERNELILYFQPRVNAQDLTLEGVEALVRWKHPKFGLVSPNSFISIAEANGYIIKLGEWVLENACKQAIKLPGSVYVSVNLSPKQIYYPEFAETVNRIVQRSQLDGTRLEFEITEGFMLDANEEALKILHDLKAIGARLAIDDFGTGYSSLKYLQDYPFDILKIDRTFICDIDTCRKKTAIVRTIIALAHELGIKVTAEGVETRQQVELLQEMGCDEFQGYLLGRPAPLENLTILRHHFQSFSSLLIGEHTKIGGNLSQKHQN